MRGNPDALHGRDGAAVKRTRARHDGTNGVTAAQRRSQGPRTSACYHGSRPTARQLPWDATCSREQPAAGERRRGRGACCHQAGGGIFGLPAPGTRPSVVQLSN